MRHTESCRRRIDIAQGANCVKGFISAECAVCRGVYVCDLVYGHVIQDAVCEGGQAKQAAAVAYRPPNYDMHVGPVRRQLQRMSKSRNGNGDSSVGTCQQDRRRWCWGALVTVAFQVYPFIRSSVLISGCLSKRAAGALGQPDSLRILEEADLDRQRTIIHHWNATPNDLQTT